MEIAIVTGASSGLGEKYAKLLDGERLDELWLIARSAPCRRLRQNGARHLDSARYPGKHGRPQ